jgi:hypothetical protein
MRPDYITEEQYSAWTKQVENDPLIPEAFKTTPNLKDICISSYWLASELDALKCPANIKVRIAFSHGQLSFQSDPWESAQSLLKEYVDGTLVFDDDDLDKLNLLGKSHTTDKSLLN